MAQVDPNIALGFRLPQIQDPLIATARAQELGVNAMKMQEYQRGLQQENKLRELIASGADLNSPETMRQMYSISPKMGAEFEKSRATIQKEKVATAKDMAALEASYMKNARDMLGAVGDQNSYNVWREQTIKNLPGLANLIPPQYSPQTKVALMADANKYLDQTTISAAQQAQMDVTRRGQDITAATTRRGQDIQADPELQARIAEAKQFGDTLGKNRATAQLALPNAIETANEGVRLIDEMVGKPTIKDASGKVIQQGTRPHPGFSSYVGATLVPGMRFAEGSDTASFEVRQKQIEGRAFLEAFNALKGGGSITEKEGEKGTAAIMRMNKASSEREYIAAARELQDILRKGVEKARAKAGGGGAMPTAPATAAPAGNVIDFNSLK